MLRLRGGKGFLCFGGDNAEGEGTKSFLKSILDMDRGGCTLKEGWILRRCWRGPFPYWRRVYVTVGNDGFLNYNAEVRQHYLPCDGSVPLQGCSVEVENSPMDISGACLSLGNVLRVRVSAQGRAQGRGWWLGDFLFTPVGTESTVEEWFSAISAASNTPCTMMMLKDLDMQGVYRWIGRELVRIRGKLGPGVDADHIRRRFSENLIDGMALSKLTSDDLREMGIHRIGVRAHILESIRVASTRGADLGIRTKQQNLQQVTHILSSGAASPSDFPPNSRPRSPFRSSSCSNLYLSSMGRNLLAFADADLISLLLFLWQVSERDDAGEVDLADDGEDVAGAGEIRVRNLFPLKHI